MFWRRSVADQVDEELDFHLEMVTRELQEERQLASRIQAGIQSLRTSARRGDGLRLVEPERDEPPAQIATEGA